MTEVFKVGNSDVTCQKHGVPLKNGLLRGLRPWCPSCSEENRVRREKEEQKLQEQHAREMIEKNTTRLYDTAQLPFRFGNCTFEQYQAPLPEQREALRHCQEFVASVISGGDNSLILTGGVGTGKTFLGCAIANAVLHVIANSEHANSSSVRYVTTQGLLSAVRATWRNSRATEDEVFDRYGYCDLLILDEVGIQRVTDDEHRILFNVLNRRYENHYPTVIITNLAVSNLDRALGERVVDRLRENGKAVRFCWDSHRKHSMNSAFHNEVEHEPPRLISSQK